MRTRGRVRQLPLADDGCADGVCARATTSHQQAGNGRSQAVRIAPVSGEEWPKINLRLFAAGWRVVADYNARKLQLVKAEELRQRLNGLA